MQHPIRWARTVHQWRFMGLSAQTIELVEVSYARIEPRARAMALEFYDDLFETMPTLRGVRDREPSLATPPRPAARTDGRARPAPGSHPRRARVHRQDFPLAAAEV